MARKIYGHDIDQLNAGQLIGSRKQNLTTAERATLGGLLGAANEGLFVWDVTLKTGFTWDGAQWVQEALQIDGDVIFKGFFDASIALDDAGQPQTIEAVSGYQYVVTDAGTFDAGTSGVTLIGAQALREGDLIIFADATTAYGIQRNIDSASETVEGKARIGTQAEVNAGTENGAVFVTPAALQGKLNSQAYVRQYTAEVDVDTASGSNFIATVTHNLNLADRDAFTVNLMRGNSAVSLDVDSVDANSLTLTSLVELTDIRVTVQGAVAP